MESSLAPNILNLENLDAASIKNYLDGGAVPNLPKDIEVGSGIIDGGGSSVSVPIGKEPSDIEFFGSEGGVGAFTDRDADIDNYLRYDSGLRMDRGVNPFRPLDPEIQPENRSEVQGPQNKKEGTNKLRLIKNEDGIEVKINPNIPNMTFVKKYEGVSNDPDEIARIVVETLCTEQFVKLPQLFKPPFKAKLHLSFGFVKRDDSERKYRSPKMFNVPPYHTLDQWKNEMYIETKKEMDSFYDKVKEGSDTETDEVAEDIRHTLVWYGEKKPNIKDSFFQPSTSDALRQAQRDRYTDTPHNFGIEVMDQGPNSVFFTEYGCSPLKQEICTKGNYILWSPTNKNQQCVIECVVKALRLNTTNLGNSQTEKRRLGEDVERVNLIQIEGTMKKIINRFITTIKLRYPAFDVSFPMQFKDIHKVAEYFKCTIELYYWDDKNNIICNFLDDSGEPIIHYSTQTDTPPVEPRVRLLLEDNHAFLIYKENIEAASKKTCPICRVQYVKVHNKCNQSRIAHLNQRKEGRKNVITASEKFSKYINNAYLIFFDMESWSKDGEHTPYAIGWMWYRTYDRKKKALRGTPPGEWEYIYEWGEGCVEKFVKWLKNTVEDSIVNQYTLIGFNNAAYDNILLARVLSDMGHKFEFKIQNTALICLETSFFKTWDLYRFLPGQDLATCCRSFGAPPEYTKTCFPHKFITGWDKLNYVGVEPGEEYHWKKPPPDWVYVTTPTWNLKDICVEYLKRDVLATKFVFEKLQTTCFEALHVNVIAFVTASHMSFDVWTNLVADAEIEDGRYNPLSHLKEKFKLPLPTERMEDIARMSIYGGRVYNTVREFKSTEWDRIIDKTLTFEQVTDWMDPVDVVSLYATAMMKYEYPCGEPREATADELVEAANNINAKEYEAIPLSFFRVDYVTNKELDIPALPRKEYKSDEPDSMCKGLIWDLEDASGWYTSIDIIEAAKQGYTFTFREGLIFPEKGFVFKNYIKLALEIKCRGENESNEVLRSLGKLLCNALYGKMLQRPIIEESALIEDSEDMDKFLLTNDMTDIILLFDEKNRMLAVGNDIHRILKIRKPSYLGAFVLSRSREIMHAFAARVNIPFSYTDTDSLFYHSTPQVREGLAPVMRKNEPGYLWYDLKGDPVPKVIRAIFLGPKTYMLVYFTHDNKVCYKLRSKGIPSSKLIPDDYYNLLYLGTYEKKEVDQVRRVMHSKKEQRPFTIVASKTAKCLMKELWEGRHFVSNTESYPMGSSKIPKDTSEDDDVIPDIDLFVDQ